MVALKVIQWTTGKVGRHSLKAIIEDPRFELAGLYAFSADKVGQDAGEMVGLPATGVLATDDVDALVRQPADAVIYTPFEANLDHLAQLLSSGKNVISTNLLVNLGGIQDDQTRATLESACNAGKSSLYITGVNPGWINSLTVLMTAVCRRVESITIDESADCSHYTSPETWRALGFGERDCNDDMRANCRQALVSFQDTVYRMAEGLDLPLDALEFHVEHALVSERVDLGWFCMEEGTVGAIRAGWNGVSGGRVVFRTRVAWYLTKNLDCDWVFNDDHYHLVIEGDPGVDTRVRFDAPEYWSQGGWGILTAMPAISAIVNVVSAPPGILTLQDVGLSSPGARESARLE